MDTLDDWIETGQDGLVDPVIRAKIYELVNAVRIDYMPEKVV